MTIKNALVAAVLIALTVMSADLSAEEYSSEGGKVYVPPQLEPWIDWVLHDHPELDCPRAATTGKAGSCAWVSSIDLTVASNARFSMSVRVFGKSRVELPGERRYWPTDVSVNGQPAVVVGGDAQPAVMLDRGTYTIEGTILWGTRPNALPLPPNTGLINLKVDGKTVVRPARNGNALLLNRRDSESSEAQRNSLSVDVYRLISDNYPMTIDTTVVLSVAGQPRLVELGKLLLDGFEVTRFESPLPARLNARGNLEVQIEPGRHNLSISARALGSPKTLSPVAATEAWPAEEIWGFSPNRNLRLVTLSGAPQIDLSQTAAPFAQQGGESVQGYLLTSDGALEFSVQQRGTPTPTPNRFDIARDIWLAFDGTGYVVKDRVNASINHASRLSANYSLGRVSVNGEDELINSLNGQAPGIELQTGNYEINSFSKIGRSELAPATGWQVNTDSLNATLHLPPGWRLLWTNGADKSPDAWLSRWTLWKIFVLVLIGVLAWRFLNPGFSVLLIAATALMMHSAPGLAVVWLIAVVLLATVRHVDHEGASKFLKAASWVWLVVAALLAVSEAVNHAREAVHPQLEHSSALRNFSYAESSAVQDSMLAEQVINSVASGSRSKSGQFAPPRGRQQPKRKYSEGLQVQTGPGQPNWRWNTAKLYWDGPVSAQQTISVTLMPPAVTRAINLLIAVLLIGISALLALPLIFGEGQNKGDSSKTGALPPLLRRIAPALLLAVLSAPVVDTFAVEPEKAAPGKANPSSTPLPASVDKTLLNQLEKRLIAKPACFPDCASVEQVELKVTDQSLSITLRIHSAGLVAVPLPVSAVWNPDQVTQAGRSATVSRNPGGSLQIALAKGVHTVAMTGPVGHLQRFDLSLPLNPGTVTTSLSGDWAVTGLVNRKVARGSLGFERETDASVQDATLKPARAKPYVQIDRRLVFDQEWSMQTRVSRRSPNRGGFSINVPLLANEAVLNNAIIVANDQAQLVFGPGDQQIVWSSRLTPTETMQLIAPAVEMGAARWTLVPSNFWHLDYSGLNPVAQENREPGPTFLPEANETLELMLTQTEPVPGSTVTVETVTHKITVGARQQRHELVLNTLASQGGTLEVRLAKTPSPNAEERTSAQGNELIDVEVNGQSEPIGLIDNSVIPLPLSPGKTTYTVTWLENTARKTLFEVAETALAAPASNITTTVSMSRDRWVLLLGGPALGPGILYWGLLLVVLLIAFLITRIPALPFSGADAVLLSLGLSLANLPATLLVAVWVIALRFRGSIVQNIGNDWLKNLLQVVSAMISVVTLITLVVSVPSALLGSPEMQVRGNGSSAYFYNWFSDQTSDALPTAWVLSLPLWVYRVIMLVWSLWLAFALIRWVPWAWRAWAQPQIWYPGSSKRIDPS